MLNVSLSLAFLVCSFCFYQIKRGPVRDEKYSHKKMAMRCTLSKGTAAMLKKKEEEIGHEEVYLEQRHGGREGGFDLSGGGERAEQRDGHGLRSHQLVGHRVLAVRLVREQRDKKEYVDNKNIASGRGVRQRTRGSRLDMTGKNSKEQQRTAKAKDGNGKETNGK
jgi:hypothetical protein